MKTIEERAEEYAVIAKIRGDMPLELAERVYIEIATEQRKIDIDTIPQLYVRWLMIDGEKPSWEEYANCTWQWGGISQWQGCCAIGNT